MEGVMGILWSSIMGYALRRMKKPPKKLAIFIFLDMVDLKCEKIEKCDQKFFLGTIQTIWRKKSFYPQEKKNILFLLICGWAQTYSHESTST